MPRQSKSFDYEPVTRPRRSRGWEAPDSDCKLSGAQTSASEHELGQQREPSAKTKLTRDQAIREKQQEDFTEPLKDRILKRGHTISFILLFLFTSMVYFRPYELSPGLSMLSSSAKWLAIATLIVYLPTQLAIEGNVTTRSRSVILALLLALAALLSIPMAISPGEAWEHFTEYLKVVVMFVVMVNVVRTERRLRWMFLLTLAASLVMSIAALNDYQAGRLLVGGERIKGIIGGLFENPNDLAIHLVTMVPLAFGLFLSRSGIPRKAFYGACCLLMASAVIVTFSRGGFLGLVAAALVLAWKLGRKNRVIVIVVCLVAMVTLVALAPAEYGGRLTSIWGADATGSAGARRELFWRSLLVALRYPVFGVGIGNFHFRSIHEQVTHNAYTEVAAEIGMAAFLFYTLFMIYALKSLKRVEWQTMGLKSHARFYYLAVGLQASLIGYMVSSFFASVAFLWYVYYLVGYAICLRRIYEAAEGATERGEVARESIATLKSGWNDSDLPKAQVL